MKYITALGAILVLVVTLSLPTQAGDMGIPYVPTPTPTPCVTTEAVICPDDPGGGQTAASLSPGSEDTSITTAALIELLANMFAVRYF
jgi:hypothetical protein